MQNENVFIMDRDGEVEMELQEKSKVLCLILIGPGKL